MSQLVCTVYNKSTVHHPNDRHLTSGSRSYAADSVSLSWCVLLVILPNNANHSYNGGYSL